MSLRKTLILAVVLLAAVAYILKVQLPKDEAQRSAGVVFGAVGKEAIESIEILSPAESFTLKNTAPELHPTVGSAPTAIDVDLLKKWELADINGSRLDHASVNALLTALLALKLDEPLPAKDLDSDLSVYGLKSPELTLRVAAGAKKTELQFGKENSYVYKRYLKLGDSPDIYLVSTGLFSAASKSKNEFREKSPVNFIDSDLKSLSIQDENGAITKLEIDAKYNWRVVEPTTYSANNAVVSALTRDLRAMRVAAFLDGRSATDFGLQQPKARVVLDFKDSLKRTPLELLLAVQKATNGEDAYLKTSERDTIYRLETNPLSAIVKPVDAFRETQLFKFATDQAVQLDFQLFEAPPISIVRNGDHWSVNGKPGDDNFVRDLVEALSELRADGFPKDNRDYGFGNPRLKLVVRLSTPENKTLERTLIVGDSAAKTGNEATRYYASVDGQAEPFTISKESYKAIFPREEVLLRSDKPAPSVAAAPAADPATIVDSSSVPDGAAEEGVDEGPGAEGPGESDSE